MKSFSNIAKSMQAGCKKAAFELGKVFNKITTSTTDITVNVSQVKVGRPPLDRIRYTYWVDLSEEDRWESVVYSNLYLAEFLSIFIREMHDTLIDAERINDVFAARSENGIVEYNKVFELRGKHRKFNIKVIEVF